MKNKQIIVLIIKKKCEQLTVVVVKSAFSTF